MSKDMNDAQGVNPVKSNVWYFSRMLNRLQEIRGIMRWVSMLLILILLALLPIAAAAWMAMHGDLPRLLVRIESISPPRR